MFVFPLRQAGRTDGALVQKIAEILEIEATKCALHGFQLPIGTQDYSAVLRLSRTLETRYALRKHLDDAATEIEAAVEQYDKEEDLRTLLRKHAVMIADSYNKFLEDLEKYNKVVKLFRSKSSNSLLVARRTVQPKLKLAEAEIKWKFLRLMFSDNDRYTHEHRELLKEAGEAVMGAQHRWQCELLTFRCDADREFGKKETYKELDASGFWDYVRSKLARKDSSGN